MNEPNSKNTARVLLWISGGLAALAAALVITRAVNVGVTGEWIMRFTGDRAWSGLLPVVPVLGLILLLVGASYRKIESARRSERIITVAMLVVFLFAMQFAVGAAGEFGGQEALLAVVTPTTNLYFTEAGAVENAAQYLSGYSKRAAESEGWQLKTHPPGPVLFFYAVRSVTKACPGVRNAILDFAGRFISESSNWRNEEAFALLARRIDGAAEAAGWLAVGLLRLAAALSAVPAYIFARALYGRRKAIAAAALAGLIPSLLLFNATIDQLYPVLGLTAALIGYRAAARRSLLMNVAAGGVLFVGLMFSVSFVVYVILTIVIQVWVLLTGKKADELTRELWAVMRMTECLLIGVLLGAVAIYVFTGMRFLCLSNWVQCVRANKLFNEESGRTYLAWLAANPVLFAAFLGLPAAALFARRAFAEVRLLISRRALSAADAVTMALVCVLAALWLYGANLGEVERLWMPLMPLCAIVGMGGSNFSRAGILILLGLQGLQAMVFKLSLDPLGLRGIVDQITRAAGGLC